MARDREVTIKDRNERLVLVTLKCFCILLQQNYRVKDRLTGRG